MAETMVALQVGAVVVLAATLLVAGVAKLLSPGEGSGEAELLPGAVARPVLSVLPWVEIGLGLGLVALPGAAYAVVAAAALALTLGFGVVVGVALARGRRPACRCFGAGSARPISGATLARTLLLMDVAVLAATASGWSGLVPTLIAARGATYVGVLPVLLTAAALVLMGLHVGAVDARLHALETDAPELDYVPRGADEETEIPRLVVRTPAGDALPLRDLPQERAQLLVFVSPQCSACKEVAPLLPSWQAAVEDELEVRLVSTASLPETRAAYPALAETMLYDADGEVADALRVPGTPCAVLLGTNGLVAAGPAPGIEQMAQLLATIVQAVTVNVVTGTAHQNARQEPLSPPGLLPVDRSANAAHLPEPGAPLPDMPVRNEGGDGLLHALLPSEQVVLAWSATCGYCQQILPAVRDHAERGLVTLLVDTDVAMVRAQGITGAVHQVLAPGGAAGMLGMPGTPGAVRVRDGHVVGVGGLGPDHVLDLLEEVAGEVDARR